jgi:glutathione S-transferase
VRDEWQAALDAGEPYRRSTIGASLAEVGFIHCSLASQVADTAARFYRDRGDVVLLEIDPSRLPDEVRMEGDGSGARFPHLYGPLPTDAVASVRAVGLRSDGVPDIDEVLRSGDPGHRRPGEP